MKRVTELIVADKRYPRFGWGPCDQCKRSRLLYYVTPNKPGFAWCKECLQSLEMSAEEVPRFYTAIINKMGGEMDALRAEIERLRAETSMTNKTDNTRRVFPSIRGCLALCAATHAPGCRYSDIPTPYQAYTKQTTA